MTNLKKWNPAHWLDSDTSRRSSEALRSSFQTIQDEFDELFNHMSGLQRYAPQALTGETPMFRPSLDMSESEKAYTLTAELPGVQESDLHMEIRDNRLIISGQKEQTQKSEDEDFFRAERSYGSFKRIVELPSDVKEDDISADYENGVLTAVLPKQAEKQGKSKTIKIGRKNGK